MGTQIRLSAKTRFAALSAIFAGSFVACTQQTPNSFRVLPAQEEFKVAQASTQEFEVVTKSTPAQVDMLWVVDNSSSMEPSQDKLRRGFAKFAQQYMKPEWDIRTAVITTDTYLAHPAFRGYLNSQIQGTQGLKSAYLRKTFDQGLTASAVNPTLGSDYAKLLPGMHDGPIPGLCYEKNFYFFNGMSDCRVRDSKDAPRGVDGCVNPKGGESAVSQCVNTVSNNTVHSGKAILSTLNAGSTEQLIRDFTVNVSTGAAGNGSERGMGSLLQLLKDNESGESAFFRKGSFRIVIFLTDEEDQTMTIPANPAADFGPFTGYSNKCAEKTVDGYKYKLDLCPDSSLLVPVASIKAQLDSFFSNLDGGSTKPSYMIASIVPTNGKTISELQSKLKHYYKDTPGIPTSQDLGARYMQLGELVGNGSLSLDIGEDDYSRILDKIGLAVVERSQISKTVSTPVRTFELVRNPGAKEEMVVRIVHADGSVTQVSASQFTVSGKTLTLTDEGLVQGLKSNDRITVKYQPKAAY